MLKKLTAALFVAAASLSAAGAADAQTIKVLVLQEDWDNTSLQRNNRIQRAVLNTWQQTLNSPAYREMMARYGIAGMDVYDETGVTLDFYQQDRQRRSDEELIRLAEQVRNPTIDVVVLYTLYARAVKDPYTQVSKLLMSMSYRALDVKSKRYFGGDNIDLDRDGIPLLGCATALHGQAPDEHCVKEFVSTYGERLARDAGNALSLRLAALIGEHYGSAGGVPSDPGKLGSADGYVPDAGTGDNYAAVNPGAGCPNIPTTFIITYEGFSQPQMTFAENNMSQWRCALDLDAVDQSYANATYEYKTKANIGQTMRNIRLMMELAGINADIRNQSGNEILVRAFGLRSN